MKKRKGLNNMKDKKKEREVVRNRENKKEKRVQNKYEEAEGG